VASELAKYKTPLQNYMLIGTQWGSAVLVHGVDINLPMKAVPAMLSNITLETYIQMYTGSDPTLPGPAPVLAVTSNSPRSPSASTSTAVRPQLSAGLGGTVVGTEKNSHGAMN